MEDYEAVKDACRHCEWVGAALRNDVGHARYGEQQINDTTVRGVTPSMVPILDIDLVSGRMLNETDVDRNSAVAVVGSDVVDTLMPGSDPIDKEIRIDGWEYRIIGVGKPKGKTLGQSMDNYALIPITAFQKQHGSHDSIRISGKSSATGSGMEEAMDETRAILRARRHDRPGADDSFDIETNASLLSVWAGFSQTFFFAMIGIAAISLVVGGIVIMNIMLVSVTERTREIGIRKALGARREDILGQFLIESVALAVLGGVIGVVSGITFAKGITFLIGMPSAVPLWAVGAGVGVAASVGIFFGVYPARKAAMLDPIAALRFEN
jgi:putative ABC transport system permease protein